MITPMTTTEDLFDLNRYQEPEEKPKTIEEEFSNERVKWREKIVALAKMIKSMETIPSLQVHIYTERQFALEEYHMLMGLLAKKNSELKKLKQTKSKELQNSDKLYKPTDLSKTLENIFADQHERLELLESQINYFKETIKTIDNINYGIKSRIELEMFKRNGF